MSDKSPCVYDDFPRPITLIRGGLFLAWFVSGAVLAGLSLGLVAVLSFVAIDIAVIAAIMRKSCSRCRYYGHRCDSGMGLVVATLFPQKPTDEYAEHAQAGIVLMFLIFAVPPILAAVAMFSGVSGLVLPLLANLAFLAAFVITTPALGCRHCKMADICPLSPQKSRGQL